MMLFWWVLIIAAIVGIVVWITRFSKPTKSKSALDLLKEQYARGEISKNEFEEKKHDITD